MNTKNLFIVLTGVVLTALVGMTLPMAFSTSAGSMTNPSSKAKGSKDSENASPESGAPFSQSLDALNDQLRRLEKSIVEWQTAAVQRPISPSTEKIVHTAESDPKGWVFALMESYPETTESGEVRHIYPSSSQQINELMEYYKRQGWEPIQIVNRGFQFACLTRKPAAE